MRYDGCLLTETESRSLIDEVDAWCRRTGTNYNKLVIAAGVAVTIRHKVRIKGQRVTFRVAGKLRQAMLDHGRGITRQEHRARLSRISTIPLRMSSEEIESRRVDRTPCGYCGARADVGCRHVWSANRQWGNFA